MCTNPVATGFLEENERQADELDDGQCEVEEKQVERCHHEPGRLVDHILPNARAEERVRVLVGDGRYHTPSREGRYHGHQSDGCVERDHDANPVLEMRVAVAADEEMIELMILFALFREFMRIRKDCVMGGSSLEIYSCCWQMTFSLFDWGRKEGGID